MLNEKGIAFTYREYTREPLSADELREILGWMGAGPRDILRKRDATKLGLRGDEDGDELIGLMADNPTLIQRPIGVRSGRAVLGRPVENLLDLV